MPTEWLLPACKK